MLDHEPVFDWLTATLARLSEQHQPRRIDGEHPWLHLCAYGRRRTGRADPGLRAAGAAGDRSAVPGGGAGLRRELHAQPARRAQRRAPHLSARATGARSVPASGCHPQLSAILELAAHRRQGVRDQLHRLPLASLAAARRYFQLAGRAARLAAEVPAVPPRRRCAGRGADRRAIDPGPQRRPRQQRRALLLPQPRLFRLHAHLHRHLGDRLQPGLPARSAGPDARHAGQRDGRPLADRRPRASWAGANTT